MNSRAVQEPEAWFACNRGFYNDTQDTKGGLIITFRAHTGSSGYLFNNIGDYSFGIKIEEKGGKAELTATCYGVTHTYSVTLDEWHTVLWAPVNNIFKIDWVDQGFSGSVTSVTSVPLRLCLASTTDIATISKWNTYTGDEATLDSNLVPQSDGRYYDTVNSDYYQFMGDAPDYYTPETDPYRWLTVNPTAGTGTTLVTLTAPEYSGMQNRTTSLRIEGENGSVVYLTVNQSQFVPMFSVYPNTLEFESTGGTKEVDVTSNYEWTAEVPDWVEFDVMSGTSGTTKIQVTVSANTTIDEISGIVNFRSSYGVAGGLQVIQDAFVPTFTINPKKMTFDSTGGTQSATLYTDYYEWMSQDAAVSPNTGSTGETVLTVTMPANTSPFEKNETISFHSTNTPAIKFLGYIDVTQEETYPDAVFDDENMTVPYSAGTVANGITSTVDWTASTIHSFIKIQAVGGEPANTLTGKAGYTAFEVVFEDNMTEEDRTAQVLFYYEEFDQPIVSLFMTQQAFNGSTMFYTSTDNRVIPITGEGWPEVVSNTNENGEGKVVFAAPLTEIPASGFYGAFAQLYLYSVVLPDTVTSIGDGAFSGCSALETVEFNDGLLTIGDSAFYNTSLSGQVTLPDSLETIGIRAFKCYRDNTFTGLTLGTNVKSIGSGATSAIDSVFPETLASIRIATKTPPAISQYTFFGVATGGTLGLLTDVDYSSWLSEDTYYLGYYDWNQNDIGEAYLWIINNDTADTQIAFTKNTSKVNIEYSNDSINWNSDSTITPGQKKYIRGDISASGNESVRLFLSPENNCTIGGSLSAVSVNYPGSIIYKGGRYYKSFFRGSTVTDCQALLLDTNVPDYDPNRGLGFYNNFFRDCINLIIPPEFPPLELKQGCFSYMFRGCTSLTTAPELPYTTLADSCYMGMFEDCTSLTTAPELSVTTLADFCYMEMFNGCTSLTTAPELPATTLANSCYMSMFSGCTSLNYLKMNALENVNDRTVAGMLLDVSPTGTLVIPSAATYSDEDLRKWTGMPDGWTIQRQ